MLIRFLLSYLLFAHVSSFAVTIEFIGPCDSKPFLSKKVNSTRTRTVGELSIAILEQAKIPYQGTEKGLNQVLNSPIGLDALEIINDQEMMAYGWCFEVDGRISEYFPDEVRLEGIKHIKWFYGYAHYRKGNWVSQCLVSHLRMSPFICNESF